MYALVEKNVDQKVHFQKVTVSERPCTKKAWSRKAHFKYLYMTHVQHTVVFIQL